MRKLIAALLLTTGMTPAVAADLPTKAAPYVAPVVVDYWSGFYVGVMGGGIWSNNNTTFTGNDIVSNAALENGIVPTGLSNHASGGFVGGTIGYNRLYYNSWVLGLELDAAWTSAKKDNAFLFEQDVHYYPAQLGLDKIASATVDINTTSHSQLNWFGTVRGRVGYLFTPTTLGFVTGGLAVGQVQGQSTHNLLINQYLIASAIGNFNDTRGGITYGAGIEQKFWDRWSLKAEYRHIDLGVANWSASTSLIGIVPVQFNAQSNLRYDLALVGLNYKW